MNLNLNENEVGLLLSILSNVTMTGTQQARAVVSLENKVVAAYQNFKEEQKPKDKTVE